MVAAMKCICHAMGATGLGQRHTRCPAHQQGDGVDRQLNVQRYDAAIAALQRARDLEAKGGGPVRDKRAASEREHARLWIYEINKSHGDLREVF